MSMDHMTDAEKGQIVSAAFKIPRVQPETVIQTSFVPPWLLPIGYWVINGVGFGEGAENGIGFVSPDGNLLLYRRITDRDRTTFPGLRDVAELWIELRLPEGDRWN